VGMSFLSSVLFCIRNKSLDSVQIFFFKEMTHLAFLKITLAKGKMMVFKVDPTTAIQAGSSGQDLWFYLSNNAILKMHKNSLYFHTQNRYIS